MSANITASQLRADFPEFKVASSYPDSNINFWIGVATKLLSPNRWGDMLCTATELFVAHMITLEKRARDAAAAGGTPGQARGPINSAAVDKANVGYDPNISSVEGYGHWNLTDYGTRLAFLIECFGAGPVQVGIGCDFGGQAWAGPPVDQGH